MGAFRQRLYTGLIFALVIFLGVLSGPYEFITLVLLIGGLCMWEFFSLILVKEHTRIRLIKTIGQIMGLGTLLLIFYHSYIRATDDWSGFIWAIEILFFFSLFLVELYASSTRPFANIGIISLGLGYIVVPLALLLCMALEIGFYDRYFVLGIFMLTWANDSFAYIFGSAWGKRKLFPRISPKKTWEGTIGGGLAAAGFGALFAYWHPDFSPIFGLLVAITISIFGTLGDLVESMLKRSLGVKDSGRILPGHGGVLDRFDGFLFSLPFIYMVWLLFHQI